VRRHPLPSLVLLALAFAACGGPFPQSTLAPRSDFAGAIDDLFRTIAGWAVVVFVVVEILLLVAIIRFRGRMDGQVPRPVMGHTLLEIGWTLAPAVILVFIAVPTMRTIFQTTVHPPSDALRIEVTGHQWWWEFRYPDLGIVTANEVHLQVGRAAVFDMTSADVIHSFWVPLLGGKRDLTPGHTTRIILTPSTEGRYLGQCAEFCGVSHANMRLRVVVDGESEFRTWAAREAQPAPAPARGSIEALGQEVFGRSACIGCHTLAGVETAQGTTGPNLSHVGSRGTIGAGLFRNTVDTMRLWIANAPALKPGSAMPAMDLPSQDMDAIVAFLRSRR
jgi:cytochrome c oxidase subunit 2